jgi:hypothetical protein
MTEEELNAALYDLFLIGCHLWREADPTKAVTAAYPVLEALRRTGCYPTMLNLNLPLAPRVGLRDKVLQGAYVAHVPVGTMATRERMAALALAAGKRHLVMMIRSTRDGKPWEQPRVLGEKGYPLYLTPAGASYVQLAMLRYPELDRQKMMTAVGRLASRPPNQR